MGDVINKTELFKGVKFENNIKEIFCNLNKIKEESLQAIKDNPEQFIEETRPYIEGLYELTEEMRNRSINTRFSNDVLPSAIPITSINVPIQDYERWKRMESTVERLKARLGL